jgi:hypothetical protein
VNPYCLGLERGYITAMAKRTTESKGADPAARSGKPAGHARVRKKQGETARTERTLSASSHLHPVTKEASISASDADRAVQWYLSGHGG